MASAESQLVLDNVREIILDAAQIRLLHFGYHKTTMAEIANDAGMSAANLYRYFENKQELVAQFAVRCMNERLERLRALVRDPHTSASEKLSRYALELVDDSHTLAGTESRIGELVQNITRERPALIHANNATHYALLTEILNTGIERGEFSIDDVPTCARYVHGAFILFDVPLFVGLYSREEFDERARGAAKLLVNGLRATSAR